MCYIHNNFSLEFPKTKGEKCPFTRVTAWSLGGTVNTTAAAVIVIIIAALILAVMAGITGYTLGRARAADDTKKASEADSRLNETLVYCRARVSIVSDLLSFETELAEAYRAVALDAIAAIPEGDPRKRVYKTSFEKADSRLRDKLEEVNKG